MVTRVFSPLKFQADIGIMLTFMFFVNMLAAIILLPALAAWLIRPEAARSVRDVNELKGQCPPGSGRARA